MTSELMIQQNERKMHNETNQCIIIKSFANPWDWSSGNNQEMHRSLGTDVPKCYTLKETLQVKLEKLESHAKVNLFQMNQLKR